MYKRDVLHGKLLPGPIWPERVDRSRGRDRLPAPLVFALSIDLRRLEISIPATVAPPNDEHVTNAAFTRTQADGQNR